MRTAKEISEIYARDLSEQESLELEILRLLEGRNTSQWKPTIQEHAHHWMDEMTSIVQGNTITTGVPYLYCMICGTRKPKYQTY